MPCREIIYKNDQDWLAIETWLQGRANPNNKAENLVKDIIDQVAKHGDQALLDYTRKFDCPEFQAGQLKVPEKEIEEALQKISSEDLEIILEAAANIRDFHQRQVRQSWFQTNADGTLLGQIVRPVDRAGLYVPGGQGGDTPLISSFLMNAVPAQVAGVKRIILTSPPRPDASLCPHLLATAGLLNLTEIYRAGSAWAVAAMALGTKTIPAVDVIAGPGNIYVTLAKRLLVGKVGIDMIAGPSEIAILADDSANPDWLAADMLSQAEHDTLASAILITPSKALAGAAYASLRARLADLPRSQTASISLKDWGAVILIPDLESGIELVNKLAPEHLELALAEPWPILARIRNAGAIFLGQHSPEPLGDYFIGPNHVLPTMGTARFSSALSVNTFCKEISLIAATPPYASSHGHKIARLARLEALEAHAKSIEARIMK